jgi:hypothetical protein
MIEEDHDIMSQVFIALSFPTANLIQKTRRYSIRYLLVQPVCTAATAVKTICNYCCGVCGCDFESLFPVVSLLHCIYEIFNLSSVTSLTFQ